MGGEGSQGDMRVQGDDTAVQAAHNHAKAWEQEPHVNRRAQGLGVVKRGRGPQATCHVLPALAERAQASPPAFVSHTARLAPTPSPPATEWLHCLQALCPPLAPTVEETT